MPIVNPQESLPFRRPEQPGKLIMNSKDKSKTENKKKSLTKYCTLTNFSKSEESKMCITLTKRRWMQ